MNNKGEGKIAMIVIAAVAVIVALVLFQASAQQVEKSNPQNPTIVRNQSITGVLNTPVTLSGQTLVSVLGVQNDSTGATVSSANYTIGTCVRASDGLKGICYTATGTGTPSATGKINVSYSYYPDGYADDAGARGIIGIIILLAAVGIGISLLPLVREGIE